MKTKIFINTAGLVILMVSLSILSSCTKSDNGNLSGEQKELPDKNLEAFTIDDKDFTESYEDLTTVDYKEFYDQLSSHGEWVQVLPEEIGLQPNTALIEGSNSNSFSLSNLIGINEANASSSAEVSMIYVWKPSTELGVSIVAGKTPEYVPYTNGQWINTDAGWYFKAPTPVEETVSHFGRWVNSNTDGWLWIPGRVWAPAWVDWKENDNYVSWAPLPPSVNLVNGIMSVPVIDENNYVIVDRRYFLEPEVFKYNNLYYDNGNRIRVNEMKRTDGIIVINNTIINKGPDVSVIQRIYDRVIEPIKIQRVRNYKEVKYSEKEYIIYAPGFKKYKNKGNSKFVVIEPKSYKKYEERKIRKSEVNESKKEEKEIRKAINDNNNVKKNYDNDNIKKNDGNDNGKKNNDKCNGKGNK